MDWNYADLAKNAKLAGGPEVFEKNWYNLEEMKWLPLWLERVFYA